MAKRLFIDLVELDKVKDFKAECSYFYHPFNDGVNAIREFATYMVICRQCEYGSCVQACPVEALELQENHTLKRYNMRCISCKSCSLACPFGVILPELLPYKMSMCDYCLDRIVEGAPLCVRTASQKGILDYKEVEEDIANNIYCIGDHLAVRAIHWYREPIKEKK